MLSLTGTVTHRIKRFNRNSHSLAHTHTRTAEARTHQTLHWQQEYERAQEQERDKGMGIMSYGLAWLYLLPAQLQRLRCLRRSQSQSQSRNGWCNLRFKLGERVSGTILRWWWYRYLLHNQRKGNQRWVNTRNHVQYNLCEQRMQEKQISFALTHSLKRTHRHTGRHTPRLIDKLQLALLCIWMSETRKCDNDCHCNRFSTYIC